MFDLKNQEWSIPCVYPKNYVLFPEGERCEKIGMIVTGKISLIHYSEAGDSSVLTSLEAGDIFGDLLIFSSKPYYIGHLVTDATTKIAYLSKQRLQHHLENDADFRAHYIQNICNKAGAFNMKHKLLQQPCLKERILFYLEAEMAKQKTQVVAVPPFQYWAEILNVQRPSLSRAISALVQEGVLKRSKRTFWFAGD